MKKEIKLTPNSLLEIGVNTKKESLESFNEANASYFKSPLLASKLNLKCDLPYFVPQHGACDVEEYKVIDGFRVNPNYIKFNQMIPVDMTKAVRQFDYECRGEFSEGLHKVEYVTEYDDDGTTRKDVSTKYYFMCNIFTLDPGHLEPTYNDEDVFFPYYSDRIKKKIKKGTKLLVREKDAIFNLHHFLKQARNNWWRNITKDTKEVLTAHRIKENYRSSKFYVGLIGVLGVIKTEAQDTQFEKSTNLFTQKQGKHSLPNFVAYDMEDWFCAKKVEEVCDEFIRACDFYEHSNGYDNKYDMAQPRSKKGAECSIAQGIEALLLGYKELENVAKENLSSVLEGRGRNMDGIGRQLDRIQFDHIKPLVVDLFQIITGKALTGHRTGFVAKVKDLEGKIGPMIKSRLKSDDLDY